MSVILLLFLSMLKIGCFAFGGGYAIIALLENEFISKRKWIDHDEFMDVVAIAESTPGPIAINVATYIGYKLKGMLGAGVLTKGADRTVELSDDELKVVERIAAQFPYVIRIAIDAAIK